MRFLGPVLALLVLGSAGCEKDKPKPDDTKKSEPTPVPSDMVFNDFIPATGGPTGMRARDSGIEGGLADVTGGPGDTADDPTGGGAGAGAAGPDKLKVTEAGADPKSVRKYTFAVGKVDKRVLTITQSVAQAVAGQTAPAQEITLKISLDLTPKAVKKDSTTIEAKVTKVELPGAPPQAAAMLAPLAGLAGTFDVTPQGEAGEVSFAATPQMRNQLADNVVQGLNQAVQLLLAPLPESAIGAGAKWELTPRAGDPDQGSKRFFAKELSADSAVIETEIEMKVPRRAQQTERGTVFLQVDGKGKYVYQVKWTGVAPKVEGSLVVNQIIEAPAQKGQPKQQVTQSQTVKHLIETAK